VILTETKTKTNTLTFNSLWDQVKRPDKEMFDKFHRGELNLSRLSYGLITPIPKLTEANKIRQ